MKETSGLSVSVVMPIFNGESTIIKTLQSLLSQKDYFNELIIIDDASTDNSVKLLQDFIGDKFKYNFICHKEQLGLAKSYNEGINYSSGDLIVTLHQDVVLTDNSLKKLIAPFWDDEVVASSHTVIHPMEIWEDYNFWQKCFFSRLAGKNFSGIDGKFDCFRKEALMKVGLFDEKHFRSAGEDADIVFRLKKIGKIVDSKAKIIHLHRVSDDFSYLDIIFKQKQYSESRGVLLRKGIIKNFRNFLEMFFRELLVITLFIPFVACLSVFLILLYSFWYTKLVYLKKYKNPKIAALPFLNIYLLFVSFIYTLKGFIYGKQKV